MLERRFAVVLLLLALHVLNTAAAGDLWVSVNGDDAGDGSEAHPLATIAAAVKKLKPGVTLHLVPGAAPFPGDIRVEVNGEPDAPIVVDGHGSVISNRRVLPPDAWKDEGDGVFSRKLPNNAWPMATHWEGGFPLAWFDGQPGQNAATRGDLQPLGYFLYRNQKELKTDALHNTLFIRLPQGRTFADVNVESVAGGGGIYVGGSHVVVRNVICEYGGTDGFATHRNKGVVFEKVEARYFMDQGMSHHGAEVVVRRSHFHHNAGGGIVDVYPECRVRYEDCLVELDTFRGGVEFHKGQFEMVRCTIRGNAGKALAAAKGATVTLRDCTFIGTEDGSAAGIRFDWDARLDMQNCTLQGFRVALGGGLRPETRLRIRDCRFVSNAMHAQINAVNPAGEPAVDPADCIEARDNPCADAPLVLATLVQNPDKTGWSRKEEKARPGDGSTLVTLLGAVPAPPDSAPQTQGGQPPARE